MAKKKKKAGGALAERLGVLGAALGEQQGALKGAFERFIDNQTSLLDNQETMLEGQSDISERVKALEERPYDVAPQPKPVSEPDTPDVDVPGVEAPTSSGEAYMLYGAAKQARKDWDFEYALGILELVEASGVCEQQDLLYCELGTVHLLLGNDDEALRNFEQVFWLKDPGEVASKVASHNLFSLYTDKGDYEGAALCAVIEEGEDDRIEFYSVD